MKTAFAAAFGLVLWVSGAQAACPGTPADCPALTANGGTLTGTFAGSPTLSGTWTWSSASGITLGGLPLGNGVINVKAWGLKGDDTPESMTIAQNIVASAIATGNPIYFPVGRYNFRAAGFPIITIGASADSRVTIKGAGRVSSIIDCASYTGNCFQYFRTSGGIDLSFLTIEDMGFLGTTGVITSGSVGVSLTRAAYAVLNRVSIDGYDTGLLGSDVEISEINDSQIFFNNNGINCAVGTLTGCNQITLKSTSVSNNSVTGATFRVGSQLNLFNSDIQYNGSGHGGSTSWGLKLIDFQIGALNIWGGWFEGNGGVADVWLENDTLPLVFSGTANINGANFIRLNATNYVTNNILLTGVKPMSVALKNANNFLGLGPYVPSSSNRYWAITNAAANLYADSSNFYSDGTEVPSTLYTDSYQAVQGGQTIYGNVQGTSAGQVISNASSPKQEFTDSTRTAFSGIDSTDSTYSQFLQSSSGFKILVNGGGTTAAKGDNTGLVTIGYPLPDVIHPLFKATAVNMNSSVPTDTAFVAVDAHFPSSYLVSEVRVRNCSASASSAIGAVYTLASAGGVQITTSATLTNAVTADDKALTLAGSVATQDQTANSLFWRLTTAQGSAATCDLWLYGRAFQ